METPTPIPPEQPTACAKLAMTILVECIMDAGDAVQPGSELTEIVAEGLSSSLSPDGSTQLFRCPGAGGCNFSFVLQRGKSGLPPEATEGAMQPQGQCMREYQLRLAFWRARQSTIRELGDEATRPEWHWLHRGLNE